MSALQKLKAYFGMMPADELDEYEEDGYGGYGSAYAAADSDGYDGYASRRPLRSPRPVSRLEPADDFGYDAEPRARRPWTPEGGSRTVTPVRGALAEQPQVEPMARPRPAPEPAAHPLSKITTLHPRSYLEARTIGERYREGTPVIINLTDLDDADAKRLVDFAAGLAFGLRGSMDKVTNKVFLISPPDVDVTAEDRRRIAEGGFFG
ncbi:MAG TPA: cell division protein SepF [Pseudonocardiaceae bacterium]|jgi:cell division inhibitor SepF|nr:cell division protein SepF [Pseudonocardiaceae bacterium]